MACVRSVMNKTLDSSFEIIVVDNASTIGDISNLDGLDDKVMVLRQPTNLGFAGGNNAGITVATGTYILLLNSDTELINDAITLARLAFDNAGDHIGALSAKLIYPDGRLQYPTGAFPALSDELAQLLRLLSCYKNPTRLNAISATRQTTTTLYTLIGSGVRFG